MSKSQSQSPTSIPPAKIKAYLGTLKETVLDDDSRSPNDVYQALILVEVLLRGVLPSPNATIAAIVISTAGKTLSLSPPLVASATAAMAGRVVEKLIALVLPVALTETANQVLQPIADHIEAWKRCNTTQDERMISLLNLSTVKTIDQQRESLFNLAQDYYLQAAKDQKEDSPIMWKKALDVMMEHYDQHETTPTILPLQQLIRIAALKGNQNRVIELSYKLIQAYLASNQLEQAHETLQSLTPEPSSLQSTLLAMKIACKYEHEQVEQMAQNEYQNSKNRGTLLSLDTYREVARTKILLLSTTTMKNDVYCHAESLLPLVLRSTTPTVTVTATATATASSRHQQQAWEILLEHLQRLENRAFCAKTQHGWTQLGAFIISIIDHDHDTPLRIPALIASAKVMWMTCTAGIDPALVTRQTLIQEMLSSAQRIVLETKKAESKQDLQTIRTEANESETLILDLQCAQVTVSSFIYLSRNEIFLADLTDLDESPRQSQFGGAVLQCFMAWSGFHQTPWSKCTVTQARKMIQRARTNLTHLNGRQIDRLELLLLDLAEADAEGSHQKYVHVYERLATLKMSSLGPLLRSHCSSGMARLALLSSLKQAEVYGRASLDEADHIGCGSIPYLWTSPTSLQTSKAFHKSMARQLVADALLRASRHDDAEALLLAAVDEAPLDFDAAFALGAFRLRLIMNSQQSPSVSARKEAQTQLLKAAKLNSNKPSLFALLGLWYEEEGDTTRSVGCFSKALFLDPAHPVAGRGVLRIKSFLDVENLIIAATNTNSSLNGWAWFALGTHNAMVESDDDLAAICFQEALRCRDISSPESDSQCCFYVSPHAPNNVTQLTEVWAELASCYKRLGRYTAAVRAFTAGASENPRILCSWAEVDLELGLFDDAAEKYSRVLQHADTFGTFVGIAAFGQGRALLAMAQRDAQDGKAGAAYNLMKRAIDGIQKILVSCKGNQTVQSDFGCVVKLLGDIYTFGAGLPPALFNEDDSRGYSSGEHLRSQIAFIAQGEACYLAVKTTKGMLDDEAALLDSAIQCDLGTNILLQSQILAMLYGEGQGLNLSLVDVVHSCNEVKVSFDRASDCFRSALTESPLYAPAWCGLGCALCGTDPILAQHAFVRCLQLDKVSPDAWSNLGFLYASHGQLRASIDMMDQLTQVADTPLMWICRAALIEQEALVRVGDEKLLMSQAADAYRAALQVTKHPSALLGLSLSCRVSPADKNDARKESLGFMREYEGLSSGCNQGALLLRQVLTAEDICERRVKFSMPWMNEAIQNEIADITLTAHTFEATFLKADCTSRTFEESRNGGIDVDIVKDVAEYKRILSEPLETTVSTPQLFHAKLSLSRQLIHDPENGKQWLDLAKQMAKELLSAQGVSKRRLVREIVDSAILAANKAVSILVGQIASASRFGTHSDDVAEALVLSYWVGSTGNALLDKDEGMPHTKATQFDLQRAMMMCPDNTFVRGAMREFCDFGAS